MTQRKPKISLRSSGSARVTYWHGYQQNSFVVTPSKTPNDPAKRQDPVDMAMALLVNHAALPGDPVKALDRMMGFAPKRGPSVFLPSQSDDFMSTLRAL